VILNKYILKHFTELSEAEKLMVLEWRNHNDIRKWMYSSDLITKDSHFHFIEKLKQNKENKYFIVQESKVSLGVIYFNNINFIEKSVNIGLYVNPFFRVKGKGSILLQTAISYAFEQLNIKKIYLEVFSKNQSARNLYNKFNFKEIKSENNIIYMELKNENR